VGEIVNGCGWMKRVQTLTMTIYTEAKINLKMNHNWF